jgi:hypothetical protein
MKPIKVFVYQETRVPNKGDWFEGKIPHRMLCADDTDYQDNRDIYKLYEITPPEWAVSAYLWFADRSDYRNSCPVESYKDRWSENIPLPQTEKRCRWRGNYIGGSVITEEKYTEEEMTKSFYGKWEPVEGTDE